MIIKYFISENLWEAKIRRFLKICEEQSMEFVTREYIESIRFPAWNITMTLNLAGYDYRTWYIGKPLSALEDW